eukprot:2020560-Rhodomonas_salina.1
MSAPHPPPARALCRLPTSVNPLHGMGRRIGCTGGRMRGRIRGSRPARPRLRLSSSGSPVNITLYVSTGQRIGGA